ncbi:MAG: FAD-dependent oxidoreductase [Deferribacterales bacterium]
MSTFLKSFVLALLCMVGMIPGAYAKETVYNYDVVVVGSGAAGLAAALEAAEDGLKTALIEKRAALGGSSLFIEGTFAAGTPWQKSEYIGNAADPDEMFKQVMAYNHWRTNAPLARKWIKNSASTLGWIHDHGVIIEEPRTLMMDGNRTWHIFKDGKGVQFIETMVKSIRNAGGDIYTETAGKELITDKKGNVTGIMAETAEGDKIRFNAKGGVVIATGGFIDNKEMMKKYGIRPDYLIIGPKEGHGGDDMKMFESIGAKMDNNMGIHLAIGTWLPGKDPNTQLPIMGMYTQLTAVLRQPYLWVNENGKRFFDESQSNNWSFSNNAVELNGGMYFGVFDENIKKYMIEEGIDVSHSDWARIGAKLDKLEEGLKAGEKEGYVYKANSLEELADKMGIDKKTFLETVRKSNQYSRQGYDEEFLKPRKYLKPIEKAPFYAIKGLSGTLITLSGPLTNEEMQVLSDSTGKPIKGLYVAGCATGGVYGMDYHLILEGAASSFALNSGRFAAQHIAATLK